MTLSCMPSSSANCVRDCGGSSGGCRGPRRVVFRGIVGDGLAVIHSGWLRFSCGVAHRKGG